MLFWRTASLGRLNAWLRTTALVLLFALGAAIPANVAISFEQLCCQDEASEHSEDDGCPDESGSEGDCDCPLGCSTCCAGSIARAIAPASLVQIEAPRHDLSPTSFVVRTSPPQGVGRDILHVPKHTS